MRDKKPHTKRLIGFFVLATAVILSVFTISAREQQMVDFSEKATQPVAVEPIDLSPVLDYSQTTQLNNCRMGVAVLGFTEEYEEWLDQLHAGWFVNFATNLVSTENSDYAPIINISQNKDDGGTPSVFEDDVYFDTYTLSPRINVIKTNAQNNPGRLWLVGNEPDRFEHQNDTFPEIYAKAYHEVYHAIKEVDPTAQIANAGLVQLTPGRLQYLDIMWDAYQDMYGTTMPVDVWNSHVYILPERDLITGEANDIASIALGTDLELGKYSSGFDANACNDPKDDIYCYAESDNTEIFMDQIIAMREWMKDKGQQDKPLIISEFGSLWTYETFEDGSCDFFRDETGQCFTPNRISSFMTDINDQLRNYQDSSIGFPQDDNRLVQKWLWFSLYTEQNLGHASNLLRDDWEDFSLGDRNAFMQMGHTFRDLALSDELEPNLMIEKTFSSSDEDTATLGVRIRNNGNTRVIDPLTVTFYSDAARTQEIGSVVIPPILDGCSVGSYDAIVEWEIGAGNYDFYVEVDSTKSIDEIRENDNVSSGKVIVGGSKIFLPILDQ